MTRNATRRLVFPVVFGLVCGACARAADCPPTPATPATAVVGDPECDWVANAAGSAEKNLICTIAGIRAIVDTTGIGEGG